MDYIIISKEDYDTKMLNLLEKIAEGNVPAAYVDPKGIPTIGIGINLRANLDSVLEWFGVDMDNLSTADATIVEKIRQTVNKSYTYGPAGDASLNNAIAPLFQQLSQKNRTTFAFNDQAEARTFFTAVIAPQYEAELQNWLIANNLPELTGELYSEERAVLFSLKYNESPGGIPLLGTNLSNALQNGDRLRAWFEIRYKSNLDKMNANRRYAESDLFGIWDGASPTQTELNNFASFLNQNDPYGSNISILQLIRNYEANYNPHARTDINSNRIDETINSPDVKSHFISQYAPGATIDGNVIIGTELSNTVIPTTGNLTKQQVQNGFLKSTALNDLVLGGSGNDTITGGTGNDILMGGADDDAYIVNNGDGTDTIEDKQGNNKVMLCGKPLKFFYDKGGYQYTTADGTITAEMQETDLVVTHTASGTKVILNEDFQPGDFGINLLNMPDAPTTTILGDLTPTSDPPQYDSLGNVIVDPSTPSPDRNDYLYDSTANDRIEGKGGNDILHAMRGGDDLLAGGEGNDIILAGEGNDNVFGENEGEMDDLVTAGETAQNINEKGDLATGSVGNDLVYGSNRKDALFGGAGFDLLAGGGGDDLIYGDSDFTTAQLDWSYTADAGLVNFTDVAFAPGTSQGDDAIHAGSGNDIVFGDGGADEIYGGEGDDQLFGDASVSNVAANLHGGDYIDGGAGNDWIIGSGGADDIYGGTGNDELYGDAGSLTASPSGNDYHLSGGKSSAIDRGMTIGRAVVDFIVIPRKIPAIRRAAY